MAKLKLQLRTVFRSFIRAPPLQQHQKPEPRRQKHSLLTSPLSCGFYLKFNFDFELDEQCGAKYCECMLEFENTAFN